ncbi:AAA family ATPase [Sulfurimonas lithotrophica]|uniref:AAA family ATPase n=1 Tax=Sulfurimonas lithotrophica TaxID=2590022 RepID=A0A5P8P207_9BACT|nr:AAA family ATPase [Sulfurimonas lithotrophica]QFR49637.1 AAA family ATPase [Sulfurimonas lithotrophica]
MKSSDEYKKLETAIKEKLFEQDLAVENVTKTLLQSDILKAKSNVRAVFTFIGAANTGKHYLCELLQRHNDTLDNIKTFYMESYGGFGSSSENISSDNFEKEILEFVNTHPKSILVFEDLEKADLQIQLILYTLFSDYEKNEVNFSNVIVVFTTTILSSLIKRKDIQKLLKSNPLQAHTFLVEKLTTEQVVIGDGVEMAFDKKLLSLLNEHTIITFNQLSLNALIKIAARALHEMTQDFIKTSKISICYDDYDSFVSLLTLSLTPYLNARHIKQKIPKLMFNSIYDALKLKDDTSQINYKVSKEAKLFLQKILENKELFVRNTTQKHKIVDLTWKIDVLDSELTCCIEDATYIQNTIELKSHEDFHISDISFKDIAGHKKVKDELSEIVKLFKDPQKLEHFGLNIPKGMFLYGPIGMGKKLLSRAFAHEANMPYITISGSNLFDTNKIKEVYAKAYKQAPAVIIFEDIDIQGIVGGMLSSMNIEPIIEELDKLNQSFESPIFTILTLSTNDLPSDLLQANRIDIHIEVPKLDMDARRFFIEEILKKPHNKNIDVEKVVRYISGMGGDELKRIGQEASLYAARKGLKELSEDILLEQINIIKYGTKLENKQIRDIEKSMAKTAYHEAGHAVLSYVLLPSIKIEQVTVAPRSESLGFVSYHNEEYIDATSKEELFNDVCVLLAGRVAKMQKFGEDGMETGAMSDLEAATMQIYAAIAIFGMDEELGYINISGLDMGTGKMLFEDKIEQRILSWLDKAQKHTQNEVKRLWSAIDAVAQELIKKEVIDGEELKRIIDNA